MDGRIVAKLAQRVCEGCGLPFTPKRVNQQFHDANCRKRAARNAGVNPETGEFLQEYPSTPTEAKAYDREAALAKFKKMGLESINWITTGIPELDEFQQIPRGRVTQIQGPYAVGKTTLALNMIHGLRDKKVFYVDSEASLNPWLLVELELDPDLFEIYNQSAYIEDIYDAVIAASKSGKYDMIILDSLAACTSRTEAEGKATDANIGQKAKVVNKLMRIVPMELKNNDTALVIINQEREMIGTYVPVKYTPGGTGVPYAASLILGLKTIPSWRFPKDAKNGEYKGHEIEIKIIKSKVSRPHRTTKIKLYYVNSELAGKDAGTLETDKEEF